MPERLQACMYFKDIYERRQLHACAKSHLAVFGGPSSLSGELENQTLFFFFLKRQTR